VAAAIAMASLHPQVLRVFVMLRKFLIGAALVLTALLVLPFLVPLPGERSSPQLPVHGNGAWATLCERDWYVRRWPAEGDARDLAVLVHGFAGHSDSWRLIAPALAARGFAVLTVDVPPYGYSEKRPMPLDPGRCLAELAAREHTGSVLWFGHSMGAGIAAQAAVTAPERTLGLVLVDGGLSFRGEATLSQRVLTLAPMRRWLAQIVHRRNFQPERFAALLAGAYGREVSAEEAELYRAPLLLRGTADAVLAGGFTRVTERPDLRPLAERTLILWGEQDSWVPIATGERLHADLPGSHLVRLAEAGHNPMETHVEAFLEAVDEWISAVR
jgi:pimeloyl-ACP methyl ester carboxylesterase